MELPRYRPDRSYQWNFDHAPDPVSTATSPMPGDWSCCGLPVGSPLGVAAGPLLNGRWCLYYASLGFDIVTYKTVRSDEHPCYALPNLLAVQCDQLDGSERMTRSCDEFQGSWAVSFGMPSKSPAVWQEDIEWTRAQLAAHQRLHVSVVGTVRPGWTLPELAGDYADCAVQVLEAGADAVEINFSCPNVSTRDGQLYQQPEAAEVVARTVRQSMGARPLIVKIGHFTDPALLDRVIAALAPHVTALAMTNSVATQVVNERGQPWFDGQQRGICGDATRTASIKQVEAAARCIRQHRWDVELIGVGGISSADHVKAYLQAGAQNVQIATAAMIDPQVAWKIRSSW